MPGGQFTNLKEQARSLGIDNARWPEVARAYAEVNEMFGDIIKVTPTSKVVGDMALMMVTTGLTPQAVLDPNVEVAFPESVVSLFHGDLGQAYGGFPPALQAKVLKGGQPLTTRPGESLPPTDLEAARAAASAKTGIALSDYDLCSYLMYPKVYLDYMSDRMVYAPVSGIPTRYFFYGMEPGEELSVDIERGKTLIIRFVAVSEAHEDGTRTAFFELNGQPRSVKITDRSQKAIKPPRRKAELGNDKHVAAPMPGTIATVHVAAKSRVSKGDVLFTIEAMKMETAVRAEREGEVAEVATRVGEPVDAKDLLLAYS
jgi:pyruvate carboxylase